MIFDLSIVAAVFVMFWIGQMVALRQELRAIRREIANIADQTDPLSMALFSHDRREGKRRRREFEGKSPNRESGRADPVASEGKPEC